MENVTCSNIKFYGPAKKIEGQSISRIQESQTNGLTLTCVHIDPDTSIIQEGFNKEAKLCVLRIYRLETYPLPKHALILYRNVTHLEIKDYTRDISKVFHLAMLLPSLYKIFVGHTALCDGSLDQTPITQQPITQSKSVKKAFVRLDVRFYNETEQRRVRIVSRVQQVAFWLKHLCPNMVMMEFVLPHGVDISEFEFRALKISRFDPPNPAHDHLLSPKVVPHSEDGKEMISSQSRGHKGRRRESADEAQDSENHIHERHDDESKQTRRSAPEETEIPDLQDEMERDMDEDSGGSSAPADPEDDDDDVQFIEETRGTVIPGISRFRKGRQESSDSGPVGHGKPRHFNSRE